MTDLVCLTSGATLLWLVEGPRFVDLLLGAIKSQSYLKPPPAPTSTVSPRHAKQESSGGIPIPLDSLVKPAPSYPARNTHSSSNSHSSSNPLRRKRSFDGDDRPPPPKGPRLSEGSSSRYGGPPSSGSSGSRGGYRDGPLPNAPRGNGPPNENLRSNGHSSFHENEQRRPGTEGSNNGPPRGRDGGRPGPSNSERQTCRDYHGMSISFSAL